MIETMRSTLLPIVLLLATGAIAAAAAPAPTPAPMPTTAPTPPRADDPLVRPIAADNAARWLAPQPPTRIHGNTYLVGFGGLNVALIRTSAGLVLVDGALPQGVPQIREHLRRLGFALADVKYILSTEPHYDHAGGLAALARDTGATVISSARAADVLRAGRTGPDDPQAAWLAEFPAVRTVRTVRDGETLRLGDVTIVARATPGHTPGSMSWTWRSCEREGCADVVFASSLNPLAAENYRYSDPANAELLRAFRTTFATLRSVPCDLLITAHPEHSGGVEKLARFREAPEPNPYLDTGACRAYAERFERALDAQLAKERGAAGAE